MIIHGPKIPRNTARIGLDSKGNAEAVKFEDERDEHLTDQDGTTSEGA